MRSEHYPSQCVDSLRRHDDPRLLKVLPDHTPDQVIVIGSSGGSEPEDERLIVCQTIDDLRYVAGTEGGQRWCTGITIYLATKESLPPEKLAQWVPL